MRMPNEAAQPGVAERGDLIARCSPVAEGLPCRQRHVPHADHVIAFRWSTDRVTLAGTGHIPLRSEP